MAGTRALFASIGASVALVAAAALSLLAVSAVFAFGGWSNSASPALTQPNLVFAAADAQQPGARELALPAGSRPIVAPSADRRAERRETRADTGAAGTDRQPKAIPGNVVVGPPAAAPIRSAPTTRPPVSAPPRTPVTKTGDHVRKVGDSLSSTVKDTASALSNATAPLAPPVSAAVQQVLNLVAEAVRQAAAGLGTTLDRLLPPKQ
ncbi:MAG TPA: hypothetical protein VNA28_13835 [Solirubrobacteraceae bacterium]|nr:hypothetical protein [Solirubrobacteraceae bacterium]